MPVYPPLNSFLGYPAALWGFTIFAPLVLLYLLKPKPKRIVFSSIMFIQHIEKSKRFHSALKKFVSDPLLLVQMIIMALLLFSVADPFYKSMDVVAEREAVIIVLDASASMKATDVYPDRFSAAVSAAKKVVSSLTEDDTVAIVLAEKIPILALKNAPPDKALDVLGKLAASGSPASLGDAMYFAKDLLAGENTSKRMYVFSDFSFMEGMDVEAAENIALREGTRIEFVRVAESHRNYAINSILAQRTPTDKTRTYLSFMVTNYGGREENIKADIKLDGETFDSIEKVVPPQATALFTRDFSVSWKEHLVEVSLDEEDELTVDNSVYAYLPELRTLRVLLISNDFVGGDRFVRYALSSINNVRLFDSSPPVTPRTEDIDTVVLGNFHADKVLPGTYSDIAQVIERGGALVVSPSTSLYSISDSTFLDLMPVTVSGIMNKETEVLRSANHEIVDEREIVFEETIVKRYFKAVAKDDTVVVAKAMDGTPLIAYRTYGKGKVVYLGISSDPEWSNFYYTSSYPILWSRLIDWVNVPLGDISTSSFTSGDYMPKVKGAVTVTTPSGKEIASTNLLLDEVGVYYIDHEGGQDTVTVNLVNARESNITSVLEVEKATSSEKFRVEEEEVEVDKKIYSWFAFAALLVLLFEAHYLRRRGYYGD